MKSITTLLVAGICFSAPLLAEVQEDITSTDGYILVWHDEFNIDGAPNSTNWSYEEGFVRNHEQQWYQPQNAWCRNGVLTLTARQENLPNPNYNSKSKDWRKLRKNICLSSAAVTTRGKHEFTYGRLEVRARIPYQPGCWPSIWMLGSKYPWPACGEIDVMSFYRYRGTPSILANTCWAGPDDVSLWDTAAYPLEHFLEDDPLWTSKFHLWRMDWDQHRICIYLDGELLNETPLIQTINASSSEGANDNPLESPMYIILNLAMGSSGGHFQQETLPLHFEIDYVRFFQKL